MEVCDSVGLVTWIRGRLATVLLDDELETEGVALLCRCVECVVAEVSLPPSPAVLTRFAASAGFELVSKTP